MKAFEKMGYILKNHLFARIPESMEKSFKNRLFSMNALRFSTQCFVLVLMDLAYFVLYLIFGGRASTDAQFLLLRAILPGKIFLMTVGFFCFSALAERPALSNRFLYRNIDILYPLCHMALESMLFVASEQELGALIRFAAVPFVVGGVPILKQRRALALEVIVFSVLTILLQTTSYQVFWAFPETMFQIWLVVFPCANLVSFIIYSANVRHFMASEKEREANGKLDRIAREDELTKLRNRRDIVTYLNDTWRKDNGAKDSLSVIMVDIDCFKQLNDQFGHLAGDQCLLAIAEVFRGLIGEPYRFARYGGEEFIIVGYDVAHGDAVSLAESIRENIQALRIDNPGSSAGPFVTVSMGVATQKVHAVDHYNTIIEWADECLYYAKNAGRNRVSHVEDRRKQLRKKRDCEGQKPRPEANCENIERVQRHLQDFESECSFVYYTEKRRLEFSSIAMKLFGVPSVVEGVTRESLNEFLAIHPDDAGAFTEKVKKALAARAPFLHSEFRICSPNRDETWVALQGKCLYTSENHLEVIYGTAFDIAHLERYQHHIKDKNQRNPITTLRDRQLFSERIGQLLEQEDEWGILLFMDVDDFRAINGFHGFNTGNSALNAIGKEMQNQASSEEEPYHYKIDQFVFILSHDDGTRARQIAESVQSRFKNSPLIVNQVILSIRFTVTAVLYAHGMSYDGLMADLDIANHLAKDLPKNDERRRFCPYTDEMRDSFLQRVYLEEALARAVENGYEGFILYYQPIFDTMGQYLLGAEALLRWTDRAGRIISPDEVIPALERTGLMPQVEVWIINEACAQCARFIKSGLPPDFVVNINLSAAFLSRDSLPDEILGAIERSGLKRSNILLEVTESASIGEKESSLSVLRDLRVFGLRIAIDDFGTGYSSLSYLRMMPVDEIKVDRSFVVNTENSQKAKDFLTSIVGLVKSTGLEVCLEGVETQQHRDVARNLGIDYLQGYFFGRPCDPETFLRLYSPKAEGQAPDKS